MFGVANCTQFIEDSKPLETKLHGHPLTSVWAFIQCSDPPKTWWDLQCFAQILHQLVENVQLVDFTSCMWWKFDGFVQIEPHVEVSKEEEEDRE